MEWQFEGARQIEEHAVQVTLRLSANAETRQLWPYDFALRYTIAFSRELTMTLEVENTSSEPFTFEEALHTYFAVEDVRAAEILGLEGAAYIDKIDALRQKTQSAEPIRISQETDRIFPGSTATCIIHDPGAARRISIEKSGSKTTVVWNPWIAKAKALADLGDEEWPAVLCVESANVGSDSVTLLPRARHILAARVSVT
jgi:D-hexose-6-phosphate mutarotase